jgi:glycosyltransferase involved in cell wall biosynthesis
MKLLTTHQIHAVEVDGRYYNCSDALVDYNYLGRYRQFCDQLIVLPRCRKADSFNPRWPRIDGNGVTVLPMPDSPTPLNALLTMPALIRTILKAIKACDCYYLKLPEPMATVVGMVLILLGKKYAVEVVADSRQGILFAKKDMPFVKFYALLFDALTKFLVRRAYCATYVSQYLRKRYPTKSPQREWVFCSAELNDDIIGEPKSAERFRTDPFKIFAAGRLSAEKGHMYLVRAFKRVCELADRDVELHLIGDGPQRRILETEAEKLGISEHVCFHGYINQGPQLFSLLDQAHLLVIPSLTEGMGRGMIEAMAMGLPCLGSRVGGIPEYLDSDSLFTPKDADAIADKILPLLKNPAKLAQMSLRNFEAAKAFWPESLKKIKNEFWREIVETHG